MKPFKVQMNLVIRLKSRICAPGIRRYSSAVHISTNKGKFDTCEEYLAYCKNKNVNVLSTVFKGTLYELTTKAFLEQHLYCKELMNIGGAFDNGIDILGKWDLSKFWEKTARTFDPTTKAKVLTKSLLRNTREYHALAPDVTSKQLISLASDIKLYAQCKHHNNKLGVSLIRELIGVYQNHITRKSDLQKHYMFLISTHNLTKQAQLLLDSSGVPFIHCKLQGLIYNGKDDFYDINSWNGGALDSIYFNPIARTFLRGLNIELQLEIMKKQSLLEMNFSKSTYTDIA